MKTPYWLQVKYARLYGPRLKLYEVKNNQPFLAVARCPECGDSQKSKIKTRFYFYTDAKKQQLKCQCHNCGYGNSIEGFLRTHDETLYRELLVERFSSDKPQEVEAPTKTEKIVSHWRDCLRPVQLVDVAKQYLDSRQIPKEKWKGLYFTNNLKKTYINLCRNMGIDADPEKRIAPIAGIFFPFVDETGALCFSATRNMDAKSSLRYVTIEFQESDKIFGLDKVDKTKKVFVTEGPLDSLFLDNAVATGDASLWKAERDIPRDNLILVPDNEPRAPIQTKNIKRMIDKGFEVVLFPEWVQEKDLNDMYKSGYNVQQLVADNSFKGLRAQLEFAKWCKL